MNIVYREGLPGKDDFVQLFETTGWNDEGIRLSPGELYAALQSTWYSVSAYDGSTLVGFGRVICDGYLHALLAEIIVRPEYQGKHIGSTVVSKPVDKCNEHRIKDVQLFCAKGKAGFYEKHGFAARSAEGPGMELVRQG
ncbi:MAG: GNAT family N-acetyltransferase [bacterium]|jgi:GNAT superfamily N-acetyltransferase